MTVSPNRAQDGDRPVAADQAKMDDRLLSPALPPTLFALPNLNAAPVEATPNEDSVATAKTDSVSTPVADAAASETTAPAGSIPSTPTAKTHSPDTVRDVPAGRGWMEKIGAHTLVLVMLVIVVAAALFTSEKQPNNSQSDSVVADLVEDPANLDLGDALNLGAVDAGVASTELPIPPHVSSVDLDPPAKSDNALKSDTPSDGSSVAFHADSSVAAAPASARNYTEVEKPPVDAGPITAEPALAASQSAESPTEPILQQDSNGDSPGEPQFSRTPAGISDWIQYLPSMTAYNTKKPAEGAAAPAVDAEAIPSP